MKITKLVKLGMGIGILCGAIDQASCYDDDRSGDSDYWRTYLRDLENNYPADDELDDDTDWLSTSFDEYEDFISRRTRNAKRKRHGDPVDSDPPPPSKKPKKIDISNVPMPQAIYDELIQYTLGQSEAMQSLATFIHMHLVNIRLNEFYRETGQSKRAEKGNILLIGPTGCGKTSSLDILARFLNIPLVTGNATEWTAQGYVGNKWQDVFEILYSRAESLLNSQNEFPSKQDIIKTAEHGIIFIDEIDKLCQGSKDLSVIERVQQELLPVLQGTSVKLKGGRTLDTTNILFIAGGAFSGLVEPKSKKGKATKPITPQILERYGMLPELSGRLCNIVQFSELTKDALKSIITTSKSSFLTQYIERYKEVYEIELTFADEVVDYIAELASHQKTGARAINAMVFKLMEDKTFSIETYIGKPLHIDKAMAEKALKNFVEEEEPANVSHLMMYS